MSEAEYDWLTLDQNEEIVWSSEPKLLGYASTVIISIPFIFMFGIGLLMIAWAFLDAKNTEYVITTDNIYKKTGGISRKIIDISHKNIQDTGYKQGWFGRRYGFGTVEISTAGGGGVEMSLAHVPNPLEVQSQLDSVATTWSSQDSSMGKSKHEDEHGREQVQIDGATLEELIKEMRATREALESIEQRMKNE